MSNTKKEILEAYNDLLKKLEEKEKSELKPQKQLEDRRNKELIQKADVLSSEEISRKINDIKIEVGGMFSTITDKMGN